MRVYQGVDLVELSSLFQVSLDTIRLAIRILRLLRAEQAVLPITNVDSQLIL